MVQFSRMSFVRIETDTKAMLNYEPTENLDMPECV